MRNNLRSIFLLVFVMVLLFSLSKIKLDNGNSAMDDYNKQHPSTAMLSDSRSNKHVPDRISQTSKYATSNSTSKSNSGVTLTNSGTQNPSKPISNNSGEKINSHGNNTQTTIQGYSNNAHQMNSGGKFLSDNKLNSTVLISGKPGLYNKKNDGSQTSMNTTSNSTSKPKSGVRSFAPALPDEPGTSCGNLPVPGGLWLMLGFTLLYSLKIVIKSA